MTYGLCPQWEFLNITHAALKCRKHCICICFSGERCPSSSQSGTHSSSSYRFHSLLDSRLHRIFAHLNLHVYSWQLGQRWLNWMKHLLPSCYSKWWADWSPLLSLQRCRETLGYFDKMFQTSTQLGVAGNNPGVLGVLWHRPSKTYGGHMWSWLDESSTHTVESNGGLHPCQRNRVNHVR